MPPGTGVVYGVLFQCTDFWKLKHSWAAQIKAYFINARSASTLLSFFISQWEFPNINPLKECSALCLSLSQQSASWPELKRKIIECYSNMSLTWSLYDFCCKCECMPVCKTQTRIAVTILSRCFLTSSLHGGFNVGILQSVVHLK